MTSKSDIDYQHYYVKAKPHRGFDRPRRYLQVLYNDDAVIPCTEGFNGNDHALCQLATAMLQLESISVVLVIDGNANVQSIQNDELLAEFRLDKTSFGEQQTALRVQLKAKPMVD